MTYYSGLYASLVDSGVGIGQTLLSWILWPTDRSGLLLCQMKNFMYNQDIKLDAQNNLLDLKKLFSTLIFVTFPLYWYWQKFVKWKAINFMRFVLYLQSKIWFEEWKILFVQCIFVQPWLNFHIDFIWHSVMHWDWL